jgi:WD40 repeat protein
MQVLEGHSSFVLSLEFDDDRIVSASQDKTVRVWDFQVPGAPSSAVLRRQKKCTVS